MIVESVAIAYGQCGESVKCVAKVWEVRDVTVLVRDVTVLVRDATEFTFPPPTPHPPPTPSLP